MATSCAGTRLSLPFKDAHLPDVYPQGWLRTPLAVEDGKAGAPEAPREKHPGCSSVFCVGSPLRFARGGQGSCVQAWKYFLGESIYANQLWDRWVGP